MTEKKAIAPRDVGPADLRLHQRNSWWLSPVNVMPNRNDKQESFWITAKILAVGRRLSRLSLKEKAATARNHLTAR